MRSTTRMFIPTMFLILLAGCASQRGWVYSPDAPRTSANRIPRKVAVQPFLDQRENENRNRIGFYAIPVVPGFGWIDYGAPESQPLHMNSGLWVNFNPKEDFAKALAQEIENSGLFDEAFFSYKKDPGCLVINGQIKSTRYKATVISYGLSVEGPLLWFVGFPSGTISNELELTLSCEDPATRKVLFSKTYTAVPYKRLSFLYTLPDDFAYDKLLKSVYQEFLQDLARNIH